VIATDVGSLKDDVVDGKTGYIVKPEDSVELGGAIERYFRSELYAHLDTHRREIKEYAAARHSWDTVGEMTMDVYARLLQSPGAGPRS
jgi:glycosyltransferase involved in cell wall biosynthesis